MAYWKGTAGVFPAFFLVRGAGAGEARTANAERLAETPGEPRIAA